MLRLHYHPLSTFSQRVRIVLDEKGLEAELVVVDMPGRAHKAPPFLAMNPHGRVPVLEHDGFVLYESTAILEYLEALRPDPPLVPADAKGRALVTMHMKLCDLELGIHTGTLVFPTRFIPQEKWDVPAMQRARDAMSAHLRILDAQLGERAWLVGDGYSLADVCYTPFLRFLDELRLDVTPRVRAYRERLLARPSAARTHLER